MVWLSWLPGAGTAIISKPTARLGLRVGTLAANWATDPRTNGKRRCVSNGLISLPCRGDWNTTLFLKANGSLWATGRNDYGQLGDGTGVDTVDPKMIVSSSA